MEIADLGLSVRAFNAVCRAGIKTIPELYDKYQFESEWLHREIGQKHTHEVGDALAKHREEVWEENRRAEAQEPLKPGDYLPDYDRDLWGDAVTFEELAQMVGQLVIVNDSWYPEDELEEDGEGDVLLVTDADGDVVHLRGDTPKIYEITRQAMDYSVKTLYTKVWKLIRSEEKQETVPDVCGEAISISIESPYFTSMRTDLDAMLQKTIASMVRKESVEGSITLKISVGLFGVGDGSGIIKPHVSHKVTASITSKESVDGYVSGDYVLDYDEDHGRYTMRELPPEGGQMTLI